MDSLPLNIFALISVVVLIIVYFFLISEKINKVIAAILGAVVLILLQVFGGEGHTSQEEAFWIYKSKFRHIRVCFRNDDFSWNR